ncbi:MAG: head-tail connector protein [Alphaproteobacteria bacterium]
MHQERNRLLERAVAPASEPLTLTETKLYLRVDGSDDDSAISDMIVAARLAAEHTLRQSLITQSWKMVFDEWLPEHVALPMGPVASVTSVILADREGNSQTASSSLYYLNAARNLLMLDSILFAFRVEILYVTGYGEASAVPRDIKQAMLAHIAAMYDMRGMDGNVPIPRQSLKLYGPYREVRL